ncbi:MAG: ComEC/Rec2 family competence protein, partial [Nitratireductor sp.]
PLGLFANLLAMPIVSIAVMPLAMISVLLMPYGLEQLALVPLGKSIELIVWAANFTNSFELDFSTGMLSKNFFISALLFLATFLMPIGKLKFLSVLPAIWVLSVVNQEVEIPHIIIAQDGRTIAVASELLNKPLNEQGIEKVHKGEGALTLLYPRRNKFVSSIWLKAYSKNVDGKMQSEQMLCNKDQCSFVLAGQKVQLIYDPALLKNACRNADILLALRLKYVRCNTNTAGSKPQLILKRADFETNGTHVIKFQNAIAKEQTKPKIDIQTAWNTLPIAPTPSKYVPAKYSSAKDNKENTSHKLRRDAEDFTISFPYEKQRRPWQQRFELVLKPKNMKQANLLETNKSLSDASNTLE